MIGLFDMFKVEISPSSSHTVGPMKVGKQFVDDLVEKGLPDSVTRVAVDVYGSLSLTGKGHHTDTAIIMGFAGNEPATVDTDSIPGFVHNVEERERLLLAQGRYEVDFPCNNGIRFHNGNLSLHESGMQIHAYNGDKVVYSKTYCSIDGGFTVNEEHPGQDAANEVDVPYSFRSITELLAYYNETGYSLSGLAMQNELVLHSKKEIGEYFAHVWQTMQACTDRGMNIEGVLPDPLRVPRRASALRRMLIPSDKLSNDPMSVIDWVNMFALAVSEEDAAGGHAVTAPANGACGTTPAVPVYYDHFIESASPNIYTRYFMATGVIGTLYRINVSTSDAEVSCQGEVGVAYLMAAVSLAELLDGSPEQACVAAEIGMEYNLGLTCDPVAGQVQVSRIERNATASMKTINAVWIALRRTSAPRISLNKIIEMMCETGRDTNAKYRETSHGDLAIRVQCD